MNMGLQRNIRRIALIIVSLGVLAGLYTAVLGWWLPRQLQQQLPVQIAKNLHLQASVQSIKIHPWSLQFELNGLRITQHDHALLSFDHLQVGLNLAASLWHRGVALGTITLDRPQIHAYLDEQGHLNLLALLPPPSPQHPQASHPFYWSVQQLDLNQGKIEVIDREVHPELQSDIHPLNIHLRHLSALPDHEGSMHVFAELGDGTHLHLQGTMESSPLQATGRLAISHLPLQSWSPLLPTLPVVVRDGLVEAQVDFSIKTGHANEQILINHGEIEIDNLDVLTPKHPGPQITLQQLAIHDISLDISQHHARVGSILLNHGHLELIRNARGQWLGVPSTQPSQVSSTTTASPPQTTLPWTWQVGSLNLLDWQIGIHDASMGSPMAMQVQNLALTTGLLSQNLTEPISATIMGRWMPHGTWKVQTQVTPTPLHVEADINANGLSLLPLQPLLTHLSYVSLRQGSISSQGHLHLQPASSPRLSYLGQISLDHLSLDDSRDQSPLLSWARVSLPKFIYQQTPDNLSIPRVEIQDPYARIGISRQRIVNLSTLRRPVPAASSRIQKIVTASPPAHPLPIHVGEVDFNNGAMAFSDLSLQMPFSAGINQLQGKILNIDSRQNHLAQIQLNGRLNHYGKVNIQGTVNPLARDLFLNLGMSFHDVELTSLTPYAAQFAGYRINQGKLDMDLHYHIEHQQLESENKVTLNQIQLGQPVNSPDAVHLPLKLALALLKDSSGNIDIDLPITGSLNNPDFRYGRVLWSAVVNLFKKVALSPFHALAHLIGGLDESAIKQVNFAAGSSELDATAQKNMTALSQALAQRPTLLLRIHTMTDKQADTYGLKTQTFNTELAQRMQPASNPETVMESWLRSSPGGQTTLKNLHNLAMVPDPQSHAQQPPLILNHQDYVQRLRDALIQQTSLGAGALRTLAQARSEAIKAAIIGQGNVADNRLFMVDPASTQAVQGQVQVPLELDAP
ncbi:MAG: DUF748 domain-containing protein [Pseudomonadales bacterium]|nr:DUF748 domain-containing protein [Pseudomonadales bacterium]